MKSKTLSLNKLKPQNKALARVSRKRNQKNYQYQKRKKEDLHDSADKKKKVNYY